MKTTEATWPRVAEYGEVERTKAPRSNVTVIEESPGRRLHREPMVRLVQATEGYEPAGSMMRWTGAFFGVWWDSDGARHGARYVDEAKAREHFGRVTGGEG